MATRVIIKNKMRRFVKQNADVMDSALDRMGEGVKQVAQSQVPYLDGDLHDSAEHKRVSQLRHQVSFGNSKVDYAVYQERGMRADGSRVVRRYTTPSTGKAYLRKAGKTISKDAINYLRQAVQLIRYKI